MNKQIKILVGFTILGLLFSCKTYIIPVDSFRKQMESTKSTTMKEVEINNPLNYGSILYDANQIESLLVIDKSGNTTILKNSPSIEMRVTQKNGKKCYFYFDTAYLENDTLKAGRSRFMQSLKHQIPLDSIAKIEVQDGKKNFNYQN